MILRKMKEISEAYLRCAVVEAVVTVPVFFNDSQKQATKDAAEIAGLHVLRIYAEPTLAAVGYAFDRGEEVERNVLVYDLGGGSFDVSLLTVEDQIYDVKAVAGDIHLGGSDFDNRVLDYCIQHFKHCNEGKSIEGNDVSMQRLRVQCERAKRTLSSSLRATIEVDALYEDIDFSCTLTRERFEELNLDLFLNTMKPVERVLDDSGIDKGNIDAVLLVGDSTSIPKLRSMVQDFFNVFLPNMLYGSPQPSPVSKPLYSPLNVHYNHTTPMTMNNHHNHYQPSTFAGPHYRSPRTAGTSYPTTPMGFAVHQASPSKTVIRRNSYNGAGSLQRPSTPGYSFTSFDPLSPPSIAVTPRIQSRQSLTAARKPSFTFGGPPSTGSVIGSPSNHHNRPDQITRHRTSAAHLGGQPGFNKSHTTSENQPEQWATTPLGLLSAINSSSTRPTPRTPETVASTPPPHAGRAEVKYPDGAPRTAKKVSFVIKEDASDAGSSPRIPSECTLPSMTPDVVRAGSLSPSPPPFATSPGGHLLMRAKTTSFATHTSSEIDTFRSVLGEVMSHTRRLLRLAEEVSLHGLPTTPASFRRLVVAIIDRLSCSTLRSSLQGRLLNSNYNSLLSTLPDTAVERLWSRFRRDGSEYGPTGAVESILVLLYDALASRECRGSLVVGRRLKEYYTVSDQCVGGGAYGTVRFCWPNVRRPADLATPMAMPGATSPKDIHEMRMMRQRSAGVHNTPLQQRHGGSTALGPRKSPDVVAMPSRSCRVVKSISTNAQKCSSGVGVVLLGEVAAMLSLDHPCIVKMHEYFHGPSGIHIIMDRVPGITLSVALETAKTQGSCIHFDEAVEIVHQLTFAVAHTYSRKIIHKDIKLCNIVVNGLRMQQHQPSSPCSSHHPPELTSPSEHSSRFLRLRVTLLDFGFAETLSDPRERRSKAEGSPMYAAPEVFERNFGLLCDSWSLGVVAYSLFTNGSFPFQCSNVDELTNILLQSDYHDHSKQPWHAAIRNCVSSIDPAAGDFVYRCLQRDEAQRYSAPQLVHHELLLRRPTGMVTGAVCPIPEPLFKAAYNFAGADDEQREAHRLVASRTSVGSNSSRLSRFFLQLASPTHGHISNDELERAFARHSNTETAREIVAQLRKDGRGHIGFSEFVAAVTYRCLPIDPCLSDEIYRYVVRHSDHHGHYSTLRRYLHSSRAFMKYPQGYTRR
ncbi:70-kilodalton heat shock protein [Perkinsus chesapeaki]|uniref:70-kilodalton heat shock protein n=1 Tax=Perkinsus chesapeaki TaxID=330153 RepID=A0A7J6LGG1_PERCH|nr:70-kilodalton heat shock protein [Perkinsus chesapeaki]